MVADMFLLFRSHCKVAERLLEIPVRSQTSTLCCNTTTSLSSTATMLPCTLRCESPQVEMMTLVLVATQKTPRRVLKARMRPPLGFSRTARRRTKWTITRRMVKLCSTGLARGIFEASFVLHREALQLRCTHAKVLASALKRAITDTEKMQKALRTETL